MNQIFLTVLFTSSFFLAEAQEQFTQLYGTQEIGDKLSLYGNRLGNTNMYGLGVESSTMYYKSAAIHRWYTAGNADDGTSSPMELSSYSLFLKTIFKSTDKLSLVTNSSSLGDIVSLYGDRLGNENMYGFGIETSGGVLYNKAFSGYNWYIGTNADQGTSAIMKLNNNELVVDGRIRSEEVKVEVINAPDYVFDPDYKLRTLKETRQFIKENKHLPEIPSAKEMHANGIELGDMNMRLLKKIEELTLYQIDLLEKLKEQDKQLQEQKSRIEKLENKK